MALSPDYQIRNMPLSEVIACTAGGSGSRPLPPGEVIIATARPEEYDPAMDSGLLPLLSEDERERMGRFRFDRDQRLFLLSHALLRLTLSLFERVEPGAWQFRTGEYGRPEIAEPSSRLRFNISHTRGLAACAVVLDSDIGFDVEETSRDVPIDNLESFFSSLEAENVRSTPGDGHRERFFTYWTLKEAYIKARGMGLSLCLDRFSMYEDSEKVWRISFHPSLKDDPDRWWFWSSRITENHQAALALSPAVPHGNEA